MSNNIVKVEMDCGKIVYVDIYEMEYIVNKYGGYIPLGQEREFVDYYFGKKCSKEETNTLTKCVIKKNKEMHEDYRKYKEELVIMPSTNLQ